MYADIKKYNKAQKGEYAKICVRLANLIDSNLKKFESKIWHGHPVWFHEGNPVVGYSNLKAGIRLLFWSGNDFDEAQLVPGSGKFRDAAITYIKVADIAEKDIKRWLKKAVIIQWDYKNIVKRKGKLIRLK